MRRDAKQARRVWPAFLELLQLCQPDECLQRKTHDRKILHRLSADVDMLMHCAIRNLQGGSFPPIEALVVDDGETFTFQDKDRLLAMRMAAGVPADGNLPLEEMGKAHV